MSDVKPTLGDIKAPEWTNRPIRVSAAMYEALVKDYEWAILEIERLRKLLKAPKNE